MTFPKVLQCIEAHATPFKNLPDVSKKSKFFSVFGRLPFLERNKLQTFFIYAVLVLENARGGF